MNEDGKQIDKGDCVYHWGRQHRQRGNRGESLVLICIIIRNICSNDYYNIYSVICRQFTPFERQSKCFFVDSSYVIQMHK